MVDPLYTVHVYTYKYWPGQLNEISAVFVKIHNPGRRLNYFFIFLRVIIVLTKESFEGLERIQDLTVQHLPDLTRFDADALASLHYLKHLRIQSWPSIERFKFRLGSVVSGLPSLNTLSALLLESNGVLYDQIIGAVGPKLRELEITGPIRKINPDAFEGIEGHELLLMIRNTLISDLPDGFVNLFKNVAHLSLDLRNNRIERLTPEVLYKNGSEWERIGTRILQGTYTCSHTSIPL